MKNLITLKAERTFCPSRYRYRLSICIERTSNVHGNFIIFHSSLIHGSAPAINTKKGRIGLVIRLVKENKVVPEILLRGSKTLKI